MASRRGRWIRRAGMAALVAMGVAAAACVPEVPAPTTTTLPPGNAWSPDTAGTRGHVDIGSALPTSVAGRPGGGLVIATAAATAGATPTVTALRADGSAEWNHTPADAVGVGPVAAGLSGTTLVAERPTGAALEVATSPAEYDPAPRVVRLLGNGQPDPAFGAGGRATLSVPLDPTPLPPPGGDPVPQERYVSGLSVDSAGRVLVVVRSFTQSQGGFNCIKWGRPFRAYLLRLTAAGQPDPAFNGGAALSLIDGNNGCDSRTSIVNLVEDHLAVRPDGRVLLHAVADSPLVQVLADGTGLDPAFGVGGRLASATALPNWTGRFSPVPLGMVLRPADGSVVLGVANRACAEYPVCFSGYVAASASGVIDPAFSPSGVLVFSPSSSAILPITPVAEPDGSFWLAGYLPEVTPTGTEQVLYRGHLSANGDLISLAEVDWPVRPGLLIGKSQTVYEPGSAPRQVVDGLGTAYLVGIPVSSPSGGISGPTAVVRLP